MKLLLVHEFYRSSAPSGEDAVFLNEAAMLKKSGMDVITYNVHNDDIDASSISKQIKLGLQTIWSRESYKNLVEILHSHKPDIVHFHNTFPLLSPSVYKACRDLSTPIVQTLHNYRMICPGALLQRNNQPCEDCITGSLYNSLKHRCYRGSLLTTLPLTAMIAINRANRNYGQVDQYIALTQFAASRMIAAGIPSARVAVKPNFLPSPPAPDLSKDNYAVFVGRLSEEKGVRTMMQAWSSLKDIKLYVLGDGPLRHELEKYCKQKQLPVTFYGSIQRDEVLAIIRKARVQILPSEWYEGFPMVILEAFASATPIIGSRIGSIDELIEEDQTGLKFQAGNAQDLSDCVRRFWSLSEHSDQMSRYARQVFEEKYTEERNLRYITDIYSKILTK